MNTPIAGIILAGGASTRMGQDKATLPWGERTLIEHLLDTLHPTLAPIIVVAGYRHILPSLPSFASIVHDTEPYAGPLLGLCEGMKALTVSSPILVTGCDYPLVSPELAAFLAAQSNSADATIMELNGELQPMPGLYQPQLLPVIQQLISTGQRSLQALLRSINVKVVPEADWRPFDPAASMLININTASQYAEALRLFTSLPDSASHPASHPVD